MTKKKNIKHEVFIKILSAFPLFTTFVSPAMIFTPASLAASFMEERIRFKSFSPSPSSMIKPTVKAVLRRPCSCRVQVKFYP